MSDIYNKSSGGNVIISEDVITSIATKAAEEVEGFAGFTAPSGEVKLLRGARTKGVRLSAEEGATDIDLFMRVTGGCRLSDFAEQVQNAVEQALDEFTSFKARSINVHITGIDLHQKKKAKEQ